MQQALIEIQKKLQDPKQRAELISQLPAQFQILFTNPDAKLQLLGQPAMVELLTNYQAILQNQIQSLDQLNMPNVKQAFSK